MQDRLKPNCFYNKINKLNEICSSPTLPTVRQAYFDQTDTSTSITKDQKKFREVMQS